ncbi:uncharacterized protein LOC113789904 [Dermatophagoides pteronyssinus]|uniref:uncharacterized protein LOC113789904 n=1 Tax=Dermatophagoides pteronyssinus TaxID=6956 RepID=UPI003F667D12
MDCLMKLGTKALGIDAFMKLPKKNPWSFWTGICVLVLCLLFWLGTFMLNKFSFVDESLLPKTMATITTNTIVTTTIQSVIDKPKDEYDKCLKIIDTKSTQSSSSMVKLVGKCCPEPDDCKCFLDNKTRNIIKKSCPELFTKNFAQICYPLQRYKRQTIVENNSIDNRIISFKLKSSSIRLKNRSIIKLLSSSSSSSLSSTTTISNIITAILFMINLILFITMIHTIHQWHYDSPIIISYI